MQRHLVVLLGADLLVLRLDQPRIDHQHVALGDIALAETIVDHPLQRTDQPDVLPHGGGIQFGGRKVPVGVVGRIAHLVQGELVIAQGDVVSQRRTAIARTDGTSAVDELHDLRQHAESPLFEPFVMVDGRRETALERQLRQEPRARLAHRFGGLVGLRDGCLQAAAVLRDRAPIVVERGLRERRRRQQQADSKNDAFHDSRIL